MPFFEGSSNFVIKAAEMNDITGDYNRHEINTGNYRNRNWGRENQSFTLDGGSNTVFSVQGRRQINGNGADLSQLQILQSLPQLLSELPSAQAAQTSTTPRPVAISNVVATPAPATQVTLPPSAMLNMLRSLPDNSWTPKMRGLLEALLQASKEGNVLMEGSAVYMDQS